MTRNSLLSIGALGALLAGPAAANIDIVFDYSYDTGYFKNNALRMSLLDSAASVFESRITDTLGTISSSGNNHFNINFQSPSTGNTTTLNDYSVAADKIVIYIGAANLGSNILGEGGPGGFGASGSNNFLTSIKRGQSGYLSSSGTDTDFGPWGGSISFNSSFSNWYFDSTLATSNDISGYDFYSVALHEIAHVLGMGTADSWNDQIVGTCTTGSCSLDGYALNYANGDKGHWKSGAMSTINGAGSFEVAMDPSLLNNTRKNFTDQDWAGMAYIGWQVAAVVAVPEPETWAMLLAGLGLVGFAAARKEKRRQN
jgi:hypothetical protein